MSNTRKGRGFSWKETTKGPFGEDRKISGFTVDDLDTKATSDAANNYEKLFILVRELLEKNDSRCMDDQEDRLQCCQAIADAIKERGLLK